MPTKARKSSLLLFVSLLAISACFFLPASFALCGDGILDQGEQCDLGLSNGQDSFTLNGKGSFCSSSCSRLRYLCGDDTRLCHYVASPSCPPSETAVLKLSNLFLGQQHAALPSENYPNTICCKNVEVSTDASCSVQGFTPLVDLDQRANAHIQEPDSTPFYPFRVCINNVDSCYFASACERGDPCIFTMSSEISEINFPSPSLHGLNAHIGGCPGDPAVVYPLAACCKIGG